MMVHRVCHSSIRMKHRPRESATLTHTGLLQYWRVCCYLGEILGIALWGVHACKVQIFYVRPIWPGGKFLLPLYLTCITEGQ